ncbi:hypothetical protein [Caballeronia sp. LZ035]|uniref:hypothetical protein n=1 Tax=Caballeronia sp. LZ035 TaxID=3038568 RepID=UPI002856DA31|nr:hypothetical protein [Caballeronia sp. LZ035]MDR5757607.1 hypothetical protein [Caballeronia sp. LZ035]
MLKTHAEAIFDALFMPLAGREASEAERSAFVHRLRQGLGLREFAQEVAAMESAWQRAVRTSSNELVQQAYRGVLGRDADPEGLQVHASLLERDGDLARLIQVMDRSVESERNRFQHVRAQWLDALEQADASHESVVTQLAANVRTADTFDDMAVALHALTTPDALWASVVRLRAEDLVNEAYAAVLKREADVDGRTVHAAALRKHLSVKTLVEGLVKSREHEQNQFGQLKRSLHDALAGYALLSAQMNARAIERVVQARNHTELVGSLAASLDSELERSALFHRKHPQIRFRPVGIGRLLTPRPLGLIFVPSEAWLPFALGISEYFQQTQSIESVLVYQEWSPAISDACALSASVFDVIELRTLLTNAQTLKLRPSFIVSHSFGWLPQTRSLLAQFSSASFFTYADAFKNEMDSRLDAERNIIGGFYFGYQPEGRKVRPQAILPTTEIVRHIHAIAGQYEFADNFKEQIGGRRDYALVYLRYWGTGPYAFSLEEVARCIVDTVTRFSDPTSTIVLKRDSRAHPDLYSIVDSALNQAGFITEDFGSLLTRVGVGEAYEAMPVEYFLSKGLLCDAVRHFVFDSSLSFHIAVAPKIERDTEIVIGAALDSLANEMEQEVAHVDNVEDQLAQERGTAARSKLAGIKTIRRYSKHYFDAVMNHTAPRALSCAHVSDGLYLVKLHSVSHPGHEQQ